MSTTQIPEPVGSDGACGRNPRPVRLPATGVVYALVVVILVVSQNLGVDPFAVLGILGAAGWATTGLAPSLLTVSTPRAALG